MTSLRLADAGDTVVMLCRNIPAAQDRRLQEQLLARSARWTGLDQAGA